MFPTNEIAKERRPVRLRLPGGFRIMGIRPSTVRALATQAEPYSDPLEARMAELKEVF